VPEGRCALRIVGAHQSGGEPRCGRGLERKRTGGLWRIGVEVMAVTGLTAEAAVAARGRNGGGGAVLEVRLCPLGGSGNSRFCVYRRTGSRTRRIIE
jgi:hypothetical protein